MKDLVATSKRDIMPTGRKSSILDNKRLTSRLRSQFGSKNSNMAAGSNVFFNTQRNLR
jgi:hypothetical protein